MDPVLRSLRTCLVALTVLVGALSWLLVAAERPGAAAGPTFTINGGGYGHGLGMSQYGALGMANGVGGPYASASQILSHYYEGTALATLSQPNPAIHVGSAGSTVLSAVSGQIDVFVNGPSYGIAGPGAGIVGVPAGHSVTIIDNGSSSGRYGIIVDGNQSQGSFGTASDWVFIRLNLNSARLDMTGYLYKRGNIVLRDGGGALDAIVQDVTMEEYLYGLGEVPSSWDYNALQAQAIAGRTYAKEAIDRRRGCRPGCYSSAWDIDGSTQDQAYVGYEKEAATYGSRWTGSVDATAGLTSTYGGNPIQAFYSSSSGGTTENSEYVFSGTLPYIRAEDDPGDAVSINPNHRWSAQFTGDELGSRIGGGVGTVSAVDVLGPRGASGRIDKSQVRVTGSAATITITGSQLQYRLGLKSTLVFSITGGANSLPFGSYDAAVGGTNSVSVQGWAIDPDVNGATEIDVWADGSFLGYGPASQYRADVASAYPGYGGYHGFSFSVPIASGTHSVCAYAIDINDPSANRGLGCRTATISAPSTVDHPPFGNVEAVLRSPGGLSLQGWALDPDTASSIRMDAYVDGGFAGYGYADLSRPDVGAAYPGYGDRHGFDITAAAGPGTHTVCLYAIDIGGSVNPNVGCTTMTVTAQPIGNLDAVARSGSSALLDGWAIDPDTASAIEIDVLADGAFAGYGYTFGNRPDVGAFFTRYGPVHGFSLSVPIGPIERTVCVYAINVYAGYNTNLGCASI